MNDVIAWNGPDHPDSPRSRPLLAHELSHVVAGHTASAPDVGFRDEAVLPTPKQRRDVDALLNPQQAATGDVPHVSDPGGFKTEMKARAAVLRDARFAQAAAVQASPVKLSTADLTDVTTIAKTRIQSTFSSYLASGIDLESIRSHIKYIPRDPGTAPEADEAVLSPARLSNLDRSVADTLVLQDGPQSDPSSCAAIIANHHVLPGDRDSDLFDETIDAIVAEAPGKWRTIALSVRGFDREDFPALQRRIKPQVAESEPITRRRGRWLNLGTAIHEMLHAVTKPEFAAAMADTENRALGVEGFTEYFTREVYDKIRTESADSAALRISIEGAPGPPIAPPARNSYDDFYDTVVNIKEILGNNEENLRQAYFRGRLEYIGLGRWNEIQRGLRRHDLGAAVLLRTASGTLTTPAYLRADWGYLVLGYTGDVQLDLRLGAGLTFITQGSRIGLGPQVSGTVRGSNLFLTGGGLIQGSAALSGPVQPGLEGVVNLFAGANIGHFQVGPTVHVLIPIVEPATARRTVDVYAGIGVSFILGN